MTETVTVAVPRKGRPLEAVLERLATRVGGHDHGSEHGLEHGSDARDGHRFAAVADEISSTLRYEKAITKDRQTAEDDVYERLAAYSTLEDPTRPEYTLLRDDRAGMPRRVVFDSVTVPMGGYDLQLIGREEPFRAIRTHEFALGFDSADLVLEEVVGLRPEPLASLAAVNDRIDPHDTDVRVVTGLGDTVYHTLLSTAETRRVEGAESPEAVTRSFVTDYEGPLCISPRYERLVQAVLGTAALDGVEFCYPEPGREEEAAIADAGLGVYLTMTGSTAREHGLALGERLFPSETVLMENTAEVDGLAADVKRLVAGQDLETELVV